MQYLDSAHAYVYSDITAAGGGAILTLNSSVLSFSGTSNFINNSADSGGGALGNKVLRFNGITSFMQLLAVEFLLPIEYLASMELTTLSAVTTGGTYGGGAIATTNTVLSCNGTTYFISNSAPWGGAIYLCKYKQYTDIEWNY